jgi:5'-deoxynucleotidase YfbR-like HD superfamily hydrolase
MTELDQGTEALADAAELLALRALQFGEIERTACQHPDGRRETDTTHTVMLTWLAPALAALLYPQLNVGLVAQFAAVHDAVEVHCGDTPTLRITSAEYAAKREREAVAAEQWAAEFEKSLPWLPDMIRRYEAQEESEARFVRAADKCCPALVHASNGARDLAEYGVTADEQDAKRTGHRAEMAAYAGEFTVLLDLRDVLAARLAVALRTREATEPTPEPEAREAS